MIYLARHANYTSNSRQGEANGRVNVGLSRKGLREAQNFRKDFMNYSVDICFSSPLMCTMQTAFSLVGDRCLIQSDDRLIDRMMGDFQGKEIDKKKMEKLWDYEINYSLDGVEPIKDLYDRCYNFLKYIKKEYPNKDILIVSHESVIRCLHNIIHKRNYSDSLEVNSCYFEQIENVNLSD